LIEKYINSGIPILYIIDDEPERVERFLPETKHEVTGEWDGVKGLTLCMGDVYYASPTGNKNLEDCLQYIGASTKPHFCIFHNFDLYYSPEQHYEYLNKLNKSKKHTVILTGRKDLGFPNILTTYLGQPRLEEYEEEFKKFYKPRTKKLKNFIAECAKASIGMKISDALNCLRVSENVDDFKKNKHDFIFSDVLEVQNPNVSLKEIGGLFGIKKWLEDRKFLFKEETDLQSPRGVILAGQSGTGKSKLSKAIANEFDLPLVKFDITKVYSQYVGISEAKFRDTLSVIEQMSPCVLRLEELNRIINDKDSPVISNIISVFLTWLQEHDKKIFTVATVNNFDSLPEELVRKGRFSEVFKIDYPDKEERRDIFKVYLYGLDIIEEVIEKSEGMTGADIEALINDSLIESRNLGEMINESILLPKMKELADAKRRNAGRIF